MNNKLTYLGFVSFDGKLYGYELIGLGLVLNYYIKSGRFTITNVETGVVKCDAMKREDTPINNFQEFVDFAKFVYIGLLNDIDIKIETEILN